MTQDKLGRRVGAHASWVDGRKVVAAAGTAVALSSTSVPVDYLIISAETDNTGYIVVGASTVVATVLTRRGTPLPLDGFPVVLEAVDLKDVYIDSTVTGDGVTYSYLA